MTKAFDLEYLIENESFITCPLLPTDQFISYCQARDISASRDLLEQFEKLSIFYPVARVRYPKIKIKVEYINNGKQYRDLGILQEGEEWSGDTIEEYASFGFSKDAIKDWWGNGLLWEPPSRPFQPWEIFEGEAWQKQIESFYSIFQCYTLHNLISMTRIEIGAEWWTTYDEATKKKMADQISEMAQWIISAHQQSGIRGAPIVELCQIISNRYYPLTQSDRRTIRLSKFMEYYEWDWYKYCNGWNAKAVQADLDVTLE